jgi:hypothetical protein
VVRSLSDVTKLYHQVAEREYSSFEALKELSQMDLSEMRDLLAHEHDSLWGQFAAVSSSIYVSMKKREAKRGAKAKDES